MLRVTCLSLCTSSWFRSVDTAQIACTEDVPLPLVVVAVGVVVPHVQRVTSNVVTLDTIVRRTSKDMYSSRGIGHDIALKAIVITLDLYAGEGSIISVHRVRAHASSIAASSE